MHTARLTKPIRMSAKEYARKIAAEAISDAISKTSTTDTKERRKEGSNMENHKPTQNQRILDYIRDFGSITQLEALRDLGVMRLASRISDLRRKGYNIVSERETVKNRYGETCHPKRYSIKEATDEQAD